MFTGLVETVAEIAVVIEQPPGRRFTIEAGDLAEDARLGDSISINGCCLTVIAIDGTRLDFRQVKRRFPGNLSDLDTGSVVNLERSLAVGDRLGGHYVTGTLMPSVNGGAGMIRLGLICGFRCPSGLPAGAAKGSIAIDGISLTVVDAD